MHQRRLEELKKLKFQRSDISPFKNEMELLKWTDSVKPLLSFDAKLQSAFAHQITVAKLNFTGNNVSAVNEAIGILNQAILGLDTTLATNVEPKEIVLQAQKLETPAKLTIKWLIDHAPWSIYAWLFGALAVSFSAGRELGKIEYKMQSSSLSNPAPITTAPTSATKITTEPAASIIPLHIASSPK